MCLVKVEKNTFFKKQEIPASGAVTLHPRYKDFAATGNQGGNTLRLEAGMNPTRLVLSGSIASSPKYGAGTLKGGYFRTFVSGLTMTGTTALPAMEMYKVEEGSEVNQGEYEFTIRKETVTDTSPPTTVSATTPMVGDKLYVMSSYMDGESVWLKESFEGQDKSLGDFEMLGDQGTATLSLRDAYLSPEKGEELIFQGGDAFFGGAKEGEVAFNLRKYFSDPNDPNRIYILPSRRNNKEGLWTSENDRREGRNVWAIYKPFWKYKAILPYLKFRSREVATDDTDSTKQASEQNTIFDTISVQSPVGNIYTASDDSPLLTSALELSTDKKVSGGQSLRFYHMWQWGPAEGTGANFSQVKAIEPTLGNRGPINPQVIKAGVYNIPEAPPAMDMGAYKYAYTQEGNKRGGQTAASGGSSLGFTTITDTNAANTCTAANGVITCTSGATIWVGMTVSGTNDDDDVLFGDNSTIVEIYSATQVLVKPAPIADSATSNGTSYTFAGNSGYPGLYEGGHLTDKRLVFPEINITMNISKLFPSPQIGIDNTAADNLFESIWGESGTVYSYPAQGVVGQAGNASDDRLMWTAKKVASDNNLLARYSKGGLNTLLRSVAITFSNYKPDPYPTLDEFLAASLDSQYWMAGSGSSDQNNSGSNGWYADTASLKYASGIIFQSFYGSSEYTVDDADPPKVNDQDVNPESIYCMALPMCRYNEADMYNNGDSARDGLYTRGGFVKFDNAGLTWDSTATAGGSMCLAYDARVGLQDLISGGRLPPHNPDPTGTYFLCDTNSNATLDGIPTTHSGTLNDMFTNLTGNQKMFIEGRDIPINTYVTGWTKATPYSTLTISNDSLSTTSDMILKARVMAGKPWGDPGSTQEPLWVEIPKDSWFNLKFVFDSSASASLSKGPNEHAGGGTGTGSAVLLGNAGGATGDKAYYVTQEAARVSDYELTCEDARCLKIGMAVSGANITNGAQITKINSEERIEVDQVTIAGAPDDHLFFDTMTTASGGTYSYSVGSGAIEGNADDQIMDYGLVDPSAQFGVPLRVYISGAVSKAQTDNEVVYENVPYINVPIPSRRSVIGSTNDGADWYRADNSQHGNTNNNIQSATIRTAGGNNAAYKYMTIWVNNYRHTDYAATDDSDYAANTFDYTFWRGQYYNGAQVATTTANAKHRAADSKVYPKGLSSEAEVFIDNIEFKYWNNEHINHSADIGPLSRFITMDQNEVLTPATSFWTSGALNMPDGTAHQAGAADKLNTMMKGFNSSGNFRPVKTGRFLSIGVNAREDLPFQFTDGRIGDAVKTVALTNDNSAAIKSGYLLFNNFSAKNFENVSRMTPDLAFSSALAPMEFDTNTQSGAGQQYGALAYNASMLKNQGAQIGGSALAIYNPYVTGASSAGNSRTARSRNLKGQVVADEKIAYTSAVAQDYGFVIDNHGSWYPTASSQFPSLWSNRAGWAGYGHQVVPVSGVYTSGAADFVFDYYGTMQNIPVTAGTTQGAIGSSATPSGSGGAINMGTGSSANWLSTDGFTQKGFVKVDVDDVSNKGTARDTGSGVYSIPNYAPAGESWCNWNRWAPRENVLCSAKLTGVPNSVAMAESVTTDSMSIITVDDPSIFNPHADDRYVIYEMATSVDAWDMVPANDAFSPSFGAASALTGIGNTSKALGYHTMVKLADVGSPIQGNKVALVVTNSGSSTGREDGVLRADDGTTELCTDKKLNRLWISPLKYWIIMGFFGDELDIKRQYENVCSINEIPNDGTTAWGIAGNENYTGSTFNESLYSYETGSKANKGEAAISINPWILDSSDPKDTSLELEDFGHGAYNEDDATGGEVGIKAAIRNKLNYINLDGLIGSNKGPKAADEPVILTLGMNNLEAGKTATIYSDEFTDPTSTNVYKPAFIWKYHDALPKVSEFMVTPTVETLEDVNLYELTSQNLNSVDFTWTETSDGDIWYRMLMVDSIPIQNKYHKAKLWIPLNETPNESTVVTGTSHTWYSDDSSSLGLTSGAVYGGERVLQDIEGLAGYAPKINTHFVDATCDLTNTDATVTMDDTSILTAAVTVSGTGVPTSTTVSSITDATTFELSANATATASNTQLTFGAATAGSLLVSGGTTANKNEGFKDLSEFTCVIHAIPDSGTNDVTMYLLRQYVAAGNQIEVKIDSSQKVVVNMNGTTMTSTSTVPTDGETPVNVILTYLTGSSAANRGPDAQLFINGKREDYLVTGAGHLITTDANLTIGGVEAGGDTGVNNFTGKIEEFIIYEKRYEVPEMENKYTYNTVGLEDSDATDISITNNAKLFLYDYHNIRGKDADLVCESNSASWRTTI